MTANEEIKNRSTVHPLTHEECVSARLHQKWEKFLEAIEGRWGKKTTVRDWGPDVLNLVHDPENNNPWEDDDRPSFPKLDDELVTAKAAVDFLVDTELGTPRNLQESSIRSVTRRGTLWAWLTGTLPEIPVCEVHFPDRRTEELAANVIAEAIYAQCDANRNQYVLLGAIVDSRKDPSLAVTWDNQELCCTWKDSSTSWQKLSNLKESHPLQVAEFAFAAQVADEPAFNWWASWVLKKRDWIFSPRTHKFEIELPKTVEEAYAIDCATGTTFWHNAIEKEMENVHISFDILRDGVMPLPDHQYIWCHMIFDVKMEDFCCKARLVAGEHATKAPAIFTYASVVS
ncbi:hypothetical protein ACHAW6_007885 [Cyclotella cf. meneghiniana]